MSKSILVIDTPENCNECQFSTERLCGNGRCTLNKDCSNIIPANGKPDWCPLRDLPKKKEVRSFCLGEGNCEQKGYQKGFNACIDEILKGSDGNDKRTV